MVDSGHCVLQVITNNRAVKYVRLTPDQILHTIKPVRPRPDNIHFYNNLHAVEIAFVPQLTKLPPSQICSSQI